MAEQPCKRPREEEEEEEDWADDESGGKKPKSYDDILSLLEEEEDVPNQDLSTFMTTLQRELSSDSLAFDLFLPSSSPELNEDEAVGAAAAISSSSSASSPKADPNEDEEQEKERVMRRLLEASDDELGLPSREDSGEVCWAGGFGEGEGEGEGEGVIVCDDGLWQIEDEAANYQTLLQSELFMQ